MSVTVKYKGNTLAELSESGTKTLKTSGKYCEGDITVENTKDGVTVTDGIIVKARNSDGDATEIDLYGATVYPYTLGANVSQDYRYPLREVTKCNFKSEVLSVMMSAFRRSKLSEAILPRSVREIGSNAFRESNLVTAVVPSAITFASGVYAFYGCKQLQACTLGGVGKGVVVNDELLFGLCSQKGLTVTVYTAGANADTALANIRNGATNATIVVKAAEDTSYNGAAFAAGETIITSTVAEGGLTA